MGFEATTGFFVASASESDESELLSGFLAKAAAFFTGEATVLAAGFTA